MSLLLALLLTRPLVTLPAAPEALQVGNTVAVSNTGWCNQRERTVTTHGLGRVSLVMDYLITVEDFRGGQRWVHRDSVRRLKP